MIFFLMLMLATTTATAAAAILHRGFIIMPARYSTTTVDYMNRKLEFSF